MINTHALISAHLTRKNFTIVNEKKLLLPMYSADTECLHYTLVEWIFKVDQGAQWLRSRVLDSRPRVRGFQPHWRHCFVVLEQDTFILA